VLWQPAAAQDAAANLKDYPTFGDICDWCQCCTKGSENFAGFPEPGDSGTAATIAQEWLVVPRSEAANVLSAPSGSIDVETVWRMLEQRQDYCDVCQCCSQKNFDLTRMMFDPNSTNIDSVFKDWVAIRRSDYLSKLEHPDQLPQ
jgi:hypothetical protein